MIYKTYGTTGIELSTIGFGGMRFRDQDDVDGCAALVKAAYDAGINYFDTAPGYGKSEALFGAAFRDMLPHRAQRPFYVSTKSNKASPDDLRRDLETSLQRMGLDYIDFYHMWCVLTPEAYDRRVAGGALKELERLKAEGLIRHICVSTHMQGEEIAAMLQDYPFEGVLLGYSAMNFAYRDAGVQAAADLNRGVVVMNPLGGGLIPQHSERFGFIKRNADETIVQGALRFLMSDPRITISLVGFSTLDQIREAVAATEDFTPLSNGERAEIRSHIAEAFDTLCTSCGYCNVCPRGIPIPKFMDAVNHALLSGSDRDIVSRLRNHWGIDISILDECTECRKCEEECTQKLPILDRFARIRAAWEAAER